MNENVYRFLINLELNDPDLVQSYDQPLEPKDQPLELDDNQLYVLDDGTQIRASQIHFDNEDAPLDLSLEQLPFVSLVNDGSDEVIAGKFQDITHKIIASPIPITDSSPKHGFIYHVPFKLVCNNTTGFEAQFTKYLEATNKTYATLNNVTKKNKSPRSLIRDNFNDKEEFRYTRDEILNMLKDSPVTGIPYENNEKKHVRKTDPAKMVQKTSTKAIDIEGLVIGDGGNKNCFICGNNVSNDKIYLFDKEDQKMHKCSPQKKMSTQLKIICETCLNDNFKPSRMKGPNQFLNSDEYLVIRDNHQYIFRKTKNFKFRTETIDNVTKLEKNEFVKFEIGSDGEIVTRPVDDDVILVHDEKKDSSSDIEIIEAETEVDKIIDNLEEADEEVKVFLGKFCNDIFSTISEVMEHGETHKHEIEDDIVYPCPLCDYGEEHTEGCQSKCCTAGAHEVKQEAVSSDDEIWIVQTADYESSGQVMDILKAAKVSVTTAGAHEVEQEAVSSDDVMDSADG
ncbi:Uncharacterized protein OBRU01_11848 [Operophtera brumata]|uniref:Uncharacterized protein n=1 Tax=Operophtera brumata TaxID=104452 RepID=A0A0L7LBF9_OPEBR|nr:Uncharacterized protein OBRU01_11848 [Operophtera brumata]